MDPAAFAPSEELQEELTDSVSRWISLWLGREQKELRHALETGATESGFRPAQLQFASCVPEAPVPADSVTVSTGGSEELLQPPASAGGSEEPIQPPAFASATTVACSATTYSFHTIASALPAASDLCFELILELQCVSYGRFVLRFSGTLFWFCSKQ